MSDSSELRASDADRERVAGELRGHFAAGRITDDELGARLDSVYASRTVGELEAVGVDLPAAQAVAVADPRRELVRRRLYQDAGTAVIASVACVLIWLAVGAHGQFWPIWVILVASMRIARDAWRLLGPAPELEPDPRGRRADRRRRRHRDRRIEH
ncbi:MAG TPA: DUF1707 domain-containing protein [Solirubrobacteraceae bacterium]|nr:DUF1707 domain-containing protein [Solirubrobacteraceae bacterium]